MLSEMPFTLEALHLAHASGVRPTDIVAEAFRRLGEADDPGIFLHVDEAGALAAAEALGPTPDGRPLWGVPFVVKDNIDVAGMPTTAACPDFRYVAQADAKVVSLLKAAGAICLGKVNLDQFATGLVGVRTPYPVPRNAVDPAIVPGGSSSGSAVAVARGIAAFALGTDTAGSGRVPAALNDIVGLKPSLGGLSASGVVPACRTLDTISIFAQTVADAWTVAREAWCHDPTDPYSRALPAPALAGLAPGMRIGVPDEASLIAGDDGIQAEDFRRAVSRLEAAGMTIVPLDFQPFYAVARMLYEGAWLAERVAAVGDRLTDKPETLHPTTRAILEPGLTLTAVDAFKGLYRLRELAGVCEVALGDVAALCVPTIPRFVTVAEIEADPIGPNAELGTYTNFVNLLDMCGIAVPTGPRRDGRPGSVTFLARAGQDGLCTALATLLEGGMLGGTGVARRPAPAPIPAAGPDEVPIVVCGAHMSGLPLNRELTALGGRFLRTDATAPAYSFHALSGGPPIRPGLVRRQSGGAAIEVEVWTLPEQSVGAFLRGIPAPLGIGRIELRDGSWVPGFLCEAAAADQGREITGFGGWRRFLASQDP